MGNFTKILEAAAAAIVSRPADLRKFFVVTVGRGKTVWPQSPAMQARHHIRWDYDGVITLEDGIEYHKFQVQVNAGKINSTLRQWREKNSTHGVIATMYIKKDEPVSEQHFWAQFWQMLAGL